MLNKMAGVTICGGYFKDSRDFKLFDKQEQRIAIIYGKNGSGKSSIAKAITEYKENQLNLFSNVDLFDYNNIVLNLQEEQNNRIFVYNEDYIRKNVSLSDDGLETIVMFGKQIDIDKKITAMEDYFNKKELNYDSLFIKNKQFSDDNNVISPQYNMNKMLAFLRKDGNWASIDANIKGTKKKSNVNVSIINNLYKSKSSKSLSDLKQEFTQKSNDFQQASSNKKIDNFVIILKSYQHTETTLLLLSKKLVQPVVSDREKLIMEMLRNGKQKDVEKVKDIFSKDETKICPFCFKEVNNQYKNDIVESIQNVLNKDVDEHKTELKSLILEQVKTDYQMYAILDKGLVDALEKKILEYNDIIAKTKDMIQAKIDNIFVPIIQTSLGLTEAMKEINSIIIQLEEKRKQFNLNINEITKIREELLSLNKQICWLSIEDTYTTFQNQTKEQKVLVSQLEAEKKELVTIKTEIECLKAEKRNVKIALEIINEYIEYIFFQKNRLTLEIKGNKYCIKSRNSSIKLNELSVGERNVISLCYFFSQILFNCTKEQAFKNECLIVLDDPISSFDFENKIGIYSFIRYMLNQILVNNPNSRVVILTHELEATYHLEKICNDIGFRVKSYVLNQMLLSNFNGRKYNEYSYLLQQVFCFANMDEGYESIETTIGNIMRRVVEAFGTFTYKKGIDALSCDPKILELIQNKKQRTYFENLMYRLVLNGESHTEERARSMPEMDFCNFIDSSEKERTAKDILGFLYLLNPAHVEAHLDNAKSIKQIQDWNSQLC